ncbi:MAG: hypothetical protein ACOX1V_00980 [Candidatus Iainarchaeum sp.]|jgi:hypothetical protein|nr:MAG: hypothetical protein BWY55_00038 [archaeon ADurb.Bin336]
MSVKIFKSGVFLHAVRIELSGKIITFSRDVLKKKKESFDLEKVTSVKLYYVHLEDKNFANYSSKNFSEERFNINFLGVERSIDSRSNFSSYFYGRGATITKPMPCAVFFNNNEPLFYIEYMTSPNFLGALHNIRETIGRKVFDNDLNKLIDNYSPELEKSVWISKVTEPLYIILMIIFMFGGFIFPRILQQSLAPPNAIFEINFFSLISIFAGILAAMLPIMIINKILIPKKEAEFISKNSKLFSGFGQKGNKLIKKLTLVGFVLYILLIFGQATSYALLTEDGFDKYVFMQKVGEQKFSEVDKIVISCHQQEEYYSPSMSVTINSENGLPIYTEKSEIFNKEIATQILSKIQDDPEIKITRCYEGTEEKILQLMESLNYPITLD